MAVADITSLICSTIAVLRATTKHYTTVKDDKGLPEVFYEAGRGLIFVQESLQAVSTQLDRHNLAGDPQSAMSLLESCKTKAQLSESIFKDVAQAPEILRPKRYKAAVRHQGQGNTVEVLTTGMMNDVCDLAENDAIKAVMEGQVKALREAIDKLFKMEVSVPNEGPANAFNQYGSGKQYNSVGGPQNNSDGSGPQFPGASFSAPVYFGSNPS
jgi:hypothetical protein